MSLHEMERAQRYSVARHVTVLYDSNLLSCNGH